MKVKHLFIFFSMAVCLFLYLFFRTDETLVNVLATAVLDPEYFESLKLWMQQHLHLSDIVVYSLPGALWVFCLTLLAKNIKVVVGKAALDFTYLPLIYAVGLEVLQLFHITNGTYDSMDVVLGVMFWWFAFKTKTINTQSTFSIYSMRSRAFVVCFSLAFLADVWT